MIAVRYSPGKVWANFLLALFAGIVVVVIIASLWRASGTLIGGITGLVVVAIMLGMGAIKRIARKEPIVTIDSRGVTIDLVGIGTIPWSQIRSARIGGIPWVIGQRLILEYVGTAPKIGYFDKLNWGIQARQKGEQVRLNLAFLEVTDQSKSTLEQALSRAAPARA